MLRSLVTQSPQRHLRTFWRCRWLSSTTKGDSLIIPHPTWSIRNLELDRQRPPVSMEELELLAKRSVLDLRHLNTTQLRQDLGNLLHMIRQVQSFSVDDDKAWSDADLYDVPRGVTQAPVRKEDDQEDETMKQVFDSLLQPKTTAVGAHAYFVVATQRASKEDKKKDDSD